MSLARVVVAARILEPLTNTMPDSTQGLLRVTILLGPGDRMSRVKSVLDAQRHDARPTNEAPQLGTPRPTLALEPLDDLEELLRPRVGSGRVLLDIDGLPAGEIGFVRRFLKRHPAWELVLFGPDAHGPALALLEAPRVRWLHWPPRSGPARVVERATRARRATARVTDHGCRSRAGRTRARFRPAPPTLGRRGEGGLVPGRGARPPHSRHSKPPPTS